MPNIDLPWHAAPWRPVGGADGYTVEWDGEEYDLASEDGSRALLAERELADAETGAVMDAVVAAQIRQLDAATEARRLEQQIAEHRATTEMYAAVNRATGMDRAQERAAQLAQPSQSAEILGAHRENYGDAWQRQPATADLAVPADEPQLDERTTQLREYRRRHGI